MDILFTAIQLVILVGCVLAFTRAERESEKAASWRQNIEATAIRANEDRSRITGVERDQDTLRRELRKVAGAFYALRTKLETEYLQEEEPAATQWDVPLGAPPPRSTLRELREYAIPGSICDNWTTAQREGPKSEAASCECSYCVGRRAERRALRAALVPKTVQGQAEVARINAGKP